MSTRISFAFALPFLAAAAIGCASGELEEPLDEMEALQQEKAQIESDLLACRARCESLERDRRTKDFVVPSELEGKVDIRRRGADTVIDLPSDVFFASGSATLNTVSERTMAQIASFIRESHPDGMIRVEGHSDSDPIRRTKGRFHCNWELSFARAHAVMHYLVDKAKFDPRRVVCEAFAHYKPLDPRNKSRNRRVEIVVAR